MGDYERTAYLDMIRDHLLEQAKYYVPDGHSLAVTFTDIDMAGDFEPWRGPRFDDIRIVKDIYPPRINLNFRLTDAEGNVVKEGRRVRVYDFKTNVVPGEDEIGAGYWRDIGTVDAYFEAQMDLVSVQPAFNLYNRRWPMRTGQNHDPPAKFVFRDEAGARIGMVTESLVSHGCIVSGGRIHRSVLSYRVRVR